MRTLCLAPLLLALFVSCSAVKESRDLADATRAHADQLAGLQQDVDKLRAVLSGGSEGAGAVGDALDELSDQLAIAAATGKDVDVPTLRDAVDQATAAVRNLERSLERGVAAAEGVAVSIGWVITEAEDIAVDAEEHADHVASLDPINLLGWGTLVGGPLGAVGGVAYNRRRKKKLAGSRT